MENINIQITTKSIFIFLGIIALGVFLYLIKNILILLFFSGVLALALEPLIHWFHKRKIPYNLAVILVVTFFVIIVAGLISYALVPFVNQLQVLFIKLPLYLELGMNYLGFGNYIQDYNQTIYDQLTSKADNVLDATVGVFSGVISVVTIVVFVIYMLIDLDNIRNLFIGLFRKNRQVDVRFVIKDIEKKLGSWFRGQLLLMFIVGSLTYIGLTILGVEYALALAVMAGLFEIVPIIGPIVATIPAALIGFSESALMGTVVILLYLLIQQFENNYVIPKVMNKVLGFNPIFTIIILMIGSKLFGLIGALSAIPFAIVVIEIARYLFKADLSQLTKSPRTAG